MHAIYESFYVSYRFNLSIYPTIFVDEITNPFSNFHAGTDER